MRVYHFLSPKYGLENLKARRLKIATLHDINDPFELLAAGSNVAEDRVAFQTLRREWESRFGMLCFSRDWRNPVQWSHYAEKHRGLCLGFDVPDEFLARVQYSAKRVTPNWRAIKSDDQDRAGKEILRWSSTKFEHWQYEQEERLFLALLEDEGGLFFREFDKDILKLREVIVGAASTLTRSEIDSALGDIKGTIRAFKARLAFGTYRIVRQRRSDLWK